MTIFFKNLRGGHGLLVPPNYAYALVPPRKFSTYATGSDINSLSCANFIVQKALIKEH